ncbi:hypothetical protein CcaCcLH18_13310 [Colletotrichum camelliae]|nr:hypothetical protein CcaCcLH18_13310 [Colletotrichum camelliae]
MASQTIKNTRNNRRKWRESLKSAAPPLPKQMLEGDIYDLPSKSASTQFPDTRYLPSLDHALYLFNTVKFHLGQTYRFFDDAELEAQIREFYFGHVAQKASESRLWFTKFLLVLAFGTAFHSRPGSSESRDPPGGLYLFSIDERESAHVYLGQAIHIAEMEGLHTQLPEDEIGTETVTWCRDLWWTLYIMDRHFSASVGLPIQPTKSSTVYKPAKTSLATYVEQTKSTLHTLAQYAQELENIMSVKFQTSVDTVPRGMRHITLLYHQCVIVATRPLLISILKERLDMVDNVTEVDWESILSHTAGIISSGIKSASKTLQVLSSEYSLLEVFLPYDLEFTYGAALHLAMAGAIFPDISEDHTNNKAAHEILSDMVTRGNRVAGVRRTELLHVELLFEKLEEQLNSRGHCSLRLSSVMDMGSNPEEDRQNVSTMEADADAAAMITGAVGLFPLMPSSDSTNADFLDLLDSVGISSEEFFSITQGMGDIEDIPEGVLRMY